MFRATAGKVPAADAEEVGGVTLPPGRLVQSQGGADLAWISTGVIPAERLNQLIRDLAAVFGTTGLWPLQAHGRGQDGPDSWDGDVPGRPPTTPRGASATSGSRGATGSWPGRRAPSGTPCRCCCGSARRTLRTRIPTPTPTGPPR
ncbi:hypothetical protein MTP03_41330 [Tsukamurella sp. PLM1]|nr:hypothetical protein MTP03_41330 [Tsukamurella sp. PLM1]